MYEARYAKPFLATARALSVCTREVELLSECLASGVRESFGEEHNGKIAVRRSPDRCIIQVGSSAVTVAWIRARRDIAEGELLIILWRGTVAPTIDQHFERVRQLAVTASPLRESVFTAEATSEADWMWHSRDEPQQRHSSQDLATLIVERLRIIEEGTAVNTVVSS